MKVSELIDILKQHDQDLEVWYSNQGWQGPMSEDAVKFEKGAKQLLTRHPHTWTEGKDVLMFDVPY